MRLEESECGEYKGDNVGFIGDQTSNYFLFYLYVCVCVCVWFIVLSIDLRSLMSHNGVSKSHY